MDALNAVAVTCDPTDPRIQPLIEAHLTLMYASSPACSVHAMDASALEDAGADFVAIFNGDRAVAMGALKDHGGGLGELKSMHVASDVRGAGLADTIFGALLEKARAMGLQRISLETGSQEAFVPARRFYERRGFEPCPPFANYTDDPASVYYTCVLKS